MPPSPPLLRNVIGLDLGLGLHLGPDGWGLPSAVQRREDQGQVSGLTWRGGAWSAPPRPLPRPGLCPLLGPSSSIPVPHAGPDLAALLVCDCDSRNCPWTCLEKQDPPPTLFVIKTLCDLIWKLKIFGGAALLSKWQ